VINQKPLLPNHTYKIHFLGELHLPGIEDSRHDGMIPSLLRSLLLYLYSGDLSHIEDPWEAMNILSYSEYFDLAFSSDHKRLINHCTHLIVTDLSPTTCTQILRSIKQQFY